PPDPPPALAPPSPPPTAPADPPGPLFAAPPQPPPLPPPPIRSLPHTEAMKAIQLYDSYLVVETEAGMLVIDQHALHERILFEQFQRRVRSGTLETQRVLIPEPVELNADQAARTHEQREAL